MALDRIRAAYLYPSHKICSPEKDSCHKRRTHKVLDDVINATSHQEMETVLPGVEGRDSGDRLQIEGTKRVSRT